jgi:hypothetical protein
MSCARYITAIVDHACGAEIAPEAARHLAACEACSARFEEQRRMLEGLDDELQRALAVVPSAAFARRVHSRIEHAPARSARVLWWSACGAAAALLLVIGINVLRSTDGVRPRLSDSTLQQPVKTATSAPTGPLVPPVVEGRQDPRRPERPVAHDVRRGPARERQDAAMPAAEVLVPPDQQRAIAHLMRLVRDGTLDASRLPVSREGESATPAELVVPPLTIEPIAVPSIEIPTSPVPAGRNSQ